jgi:hypothetical protein
MSLKLITETSYDIELNESKGSGDMYIVGIFSSAEQKNANGRVYKKDTLDREFKRINEEFFKTGVPLWGQLDHPTSADSSMEKVAIRTLALEWRGNDLYGKAKILTDTPNGAIAAALLKESKRIGISSRGLGEVSEDGYVKDESYKLITWDIVGNPSCSGAWVKGIYEGYNVEDTLVELSKTRNNYYKKIIKLLEKFK